MSINAVKMLADILDCPTGEITRLIDLQNSFDVELDIREMTENYGRIPHFNHLIRESYELALNKIEPDWYEKFANEIFIYTNGSLDSSLHIDDERICDKDDLEKAIDKLRNETSDCAYCQTSYDSQYSEYIHEENCEYFETE